MEVDTEKKIVR